MVLVLGVSAGASGARAILTHSDQPDLQPIDHCLVPRPAGASLDDAVVVAIRKMRDAASSRGELVSATAVACRSDACAEAIRSAQPRLGGDMRVVGEAVAQLRYLNFVNRLPTEGSVVLYDLGSSGLTLTLADCPTVTARRTKRTTTVSGEGFDALLQWKLARLGIVIDGETSRRHRETLSMDGVVTAEDRKSGRRIVFTNGDFADLAEAGLQHSVATVKQLIDRVEPKPDGIILLGGCTRNRQVAEQLAKMMRELPVYLEPEPELVSARGAALLAAEKPARVVRMARAISVSAPLVGSGPEHTSKRKVIAALAVTGALGATIAGLMVTDPPGGGSHDNGATPLDIANLPQQHFK